LTPFEASAFFEAAGAVAKIGSSLKPKGKPPLQILVCPNP